MNTRFLPLTVFPVLLLAFAGLSPAHAAGDARPTLLCAVQRDGVTYPSIAAALAAAAEGDTLRISGDCYEHDLTITLPLTLEGGWNETFSEHNPALYPAKIDAQGLGRALVITGAPALIIVSVRDLTLTNGNAANASPDPGRGGCVYAVIAAPILEGNTISNCKAQTAAANGYGGGVYIESDGEETRLEGNTFARNMALDNYTGSATGFGGGLYLAGPATIQGNTFNPYNIAGRGSHSSGYGGGVYLTGGPWTLAQNEITNNYASSSFDGNGYGGGVALSDPAAGAWVENNTISYNTGSENEDYGVRTFGGGVYQSGGGAVSWVGNVVSENGASMSGGGGSGGGFYLLNAQAAFSGDNVIETNNVGEGCADAFRCGGGGLYIQGGAVSLQNAVIRNNTAGASANTGQGGGVHLASGQLTLESVSLLENTARGGAHGFGGGLYVHNGAASAVNSVFAANEAWHGGGAVYVAGGSLSLQHNTIAGNIGAAAYAVQRAGGTLEMTNNIVAGHALGVSGASSLRTLFWENANDGDAGSEPRFGDPAFANPASFDFHIGDQSAALDAGAFTAAATDVDGDPRPTNPARYDAPDIGADENASLEITRPAAASMTFGAACARLDFSNSADLITVTVLVAPGHFPSDNPADPLINRAIVITPSSSAPVQAALSLCYDESELNGLDEAVLKLYRWTGSATRWQEYPSTVDAANNTVSAGGVGAFSAWAIGAATPTAISLRQFHAAPPVAPGALAAGSSLLLACGAALLAAGRARNYTSSHKKGNLS